MSNKIQVTGVPLFKRVKPHDKTDDSQSEKKQLRVLQQIFQTNLHRFAKLHKDCFNGGVQMPPNKHAMTKNEYDNEKYVLEKYRKYEERLTMRLMDRNRSVQKQHKNYFEDFKPDMSYCYTENPEKQTDLNNYVSASPIYKIKKNDISPKRTSLERSTVKTRPMSATIEFFKDPIRVSLKKPESRERSSKLYMQNRSTQLSSTSCSKRNSIQMNNVEVGDFIGKSTKKTPLFRNSIGCIGSVEYEKYEEEEVYIRKKIAFNPKSVWQIKGCSNTPVFGSRKTHKQMNIFKRIDKDNSSQAYINEYTNLIEKQKLQKKIMMINTALAFNLNQSHGYRPKSKCRNMF